MHITQNATNLSHIYEINLEFTLKKVEFVQTLSVKDFTYTDNV